MFKVYGDIVSGNCYKVKLALMQLQLPFEWAHVDILRKESRTPAFLAMNPNGQIPLLQIDAQTFLPESNAILHYLADGSPLLPQDRLEHAQVLRWMFFEQYTHEPNVASARFIVRYLGRPAEREALLQQKIAAGHEALSIMEAHLEREPFFVGGRYTIADIALYAYTHVAHEGMFDLAPYPALRAWLNRVEVQPHYIGMDDGTA
jgi:glutathione S-transferase